MQTAADAFDAKLRKRLEERIRELQEAATALPVTDLSTVNNTIGRIAGLREVFGLCDETQAELNKR